MYLLVYFLAETSPDVQETVTETAPQLIDEFLKGGPVMWPLLGLSVLTLATALERLWFWIRLVSQEDRIVHDVLDAARYDLAKASEIAEYARFLAIGRFLLAPLRLRHPTPETFRLAMESAADKEFVKMRKGDKLFETVIAIAPLLGLLGTVTGLIRTFDNLNVGGGGSAEEATKAAAGIGEALITTAAGMIVAILALLVFRLMVTLQAQQMDYFAQVGSEMELIYRQFWYEPQSHARPPALPSTTSRSPNNRSSDDY
ncbi:MotA/TolQ/ExbB proton channel family protein [Geitlerinema sp. CS-897]|uniref:MotA/TolQ/ExbB proton channel family protein n=1 Tax=Baaleninema simplex TaxID=2862350 RepID=UPI00034C615E|nr:MotA/TolQ/ExbB proton channel family protein [Baaleninema simplex]MDC0835035.1 MotA/TolQ/ExbB proton channel family protein [Geitlerinema sp. CS-897]